MNGEAALLCYRSLCGNLLMRQRLEFRSIALRASRRKPAASQRASSEPQQQQRSVRGTNGVRLWRRHSTSKAFIHHRSPAHASTREHTRAAGGSGPALGASRRLERVQLVLGNVLEVVAVVLVGLRRLVLCRVDHLVRETCVQHATHVSFEHTQTSERTRSTYLGSRRRRLPPLQSRIASSGPSSGRQSTPSPSAGSPICRRCGARTHAVSHAMPRARPAASIPLSRSEADGPVLGGLAALCRGVLGVLEDDGAASEVLLGRARQRMVRRGVELDGRRAHGTHGHRRTNGTNQCAR